jgi:hypothetical protein
MAKRSRPQRQQEPPAMGERRARWGYGYQDKAATDRILNILRKDLREGSASFEGVKLADLDAGRVDDFVLVWGASIEGNSIKWSEGAAPVNWGDLIGAAGLIRELGDGYQRLRNRWPNKAVSVRLQTNRPASTVKLHSQLIPNLSVAEFLEKYWPVGPTDHDRPEVANGWGCVAAHSGLADPAFSEFVASCHLSLGVPEPPRTAQNSVDWRRYKQQFDSLHKAIATWLTNNPRVDFIDRAFLLEAIGFRSSRSGLIQRFPQPHIPYEKNQTSGDRLKNLVDVTPGGYIVVVGPAGVGKSTLVQDVLTGSAHPFFIPYYAFLPDVDGNRDRGEALTFFQDVTDRLERFSVTRLSLGVLDLAQGRDAVRRHMLKANERYIAQGHKTILLIDGLDHVSREINLQHSVLNELPPPGDVPDGFLIILSTQPQALVPGRVPVQVASAAEQPDRRVEVSGLSRAEVHAVVSRVNKPTTGADRNALYDACLGNPLILTYLLTHFEREPETTVSEVIESVGRYRGPIDEYYRESLAVPLQNGGIRNVLGLLCRAAPVVPVAWLQEWPEKVQIEDIYNREIAPFVRVEDGAVQFIHDSLIAFLKSETRSKLPGGDPASDERAFHATLADRSSGRPCSDPVARARILHLLRANRHNELLDQLSSEWARGAVAGFLPYALIRPMIVSGLNAAWTTQRFGDVLRLILLDHELDQRTSRSEADALAGKFLDLDEPALAIAQIRASGRLLVDDKVVLEFAAKLWWYAHQKDRQDLKTAARTLYLQAKPIPLIYRAGPIDTARDHDYYAVLRAWSEAAPLFEDLITVDEEIQNLAFKGPEVRHGIDSDNIKTSLLWRTFTAALNAGVDAAVCRVCLNRIEEAKIPLWRFATLLRLAEARPGAVTFEDIQGAYSECDPSDDTALTYACFLFHQGHKAQAKVIVGALRHIRFEPYRDKHEWGFSDVTYTTTLRCLQELLEVPEGPIPEVKGDGEEAYARIEVAARELGRLRAASTRQESIPGLDQKFRSLLLFHNQPVRFSMLDSTHGYRVQASKGAIYREIAALAKMLSPTAVKTLKDVFLDLVHGPARSQFTAHHRRLFAILFFEEGALSREGAIELGLSSTVDTTDDDPRLRQEACLEIAAFLHSLDDNDGSQLWVRRSSEVSAGARSEKDYHMAELAEWLVRSLRDADDARLVLLEKFARAVEVAGGEGSSDAAALALQFLMKFEPLRATRFAVELIDRDVLDIADTIEALIIGGAKAGASARLLEALYTELHVLIAPGDTSAAAVAVLRRYPPERRREAAMRLMTCVRTNALPSHRVEIARELQGGLLEDGLDKVALTGGLKEGRDDSARKSELYRLASGEAQTVEQMAKRLSDESNPEDWNPNPTDNSEFSWWSALKGTRVKNVNHLERLLETLPAPDFREVDLLAWRCERLLELGDLPGARRFADEALSRARDASWHPWLDGAQKRVAFAALKRIDRVEALARGRDQFGADLGGGKLSSRHLLSDIPETFDLLEIEWPADAVRASLTGYLDQVLAANQKVPPYESLTVPTLSGSPDEALCRFISHLITFPVLEVGVAARRVLARYCAAGGAGVIAMLKRDPWWDPVQLEHILACIHIGVSSNGNVAAQLRSWILSLNRSDSIGVASVARRISEDQGWTWTEITNQKAGPVILLPVNAGPADERQMLVGGNVVTAWQLYKPIFATLEEYNLDIKELRSEFERIYLEIEREYPWANDTVLKRWMKSVHATFWFSSRASVGREAAMRVFGRRSLSGQIPPGAEEEAYDHFYPLYDPPIELLQPMARPVELEALEWRWSDGQEHSWLAGKHADSWHNYPDSAQGLRIIGERSWFVRPDWEWPTEERYRGLLVGLLDANAERQTLESRNALTHDSYLSGVWQNNNQLVLVNPECQLTGGVYRWAAINANFARALGWHPLDTAPFHWVDSSGNLTVKSVFWRNGWVWLEPPRHEALGEGWLVLATEEAIESIRRLAPTTKMHLWVERHSHGKKPYDGKWHLSKAL